MPPRFKHGQRVIHHAGERGDVKATIDEIRVGKEAPEYVLRWIEDETLHVVTADEIIPEPVPRQRDFDARKVAEGGRRLPGVVISTEATEALESLVGTSYASTIKGVIERALIEAAQGF